MLPVLRDPAGSVVRALSMLAYGLYLVHTVILTSLGPDLAARLGAAPAAAAMVAMSLAAAWLLSIGVERPFLRLRDRLVPARPPGGRPVPA